MTAAELLPLLTDIVAQIAGIMSFGAGLLSGLAFVLFAQLRFDS
jgi:hypothetical protein